MFHQNEAGGVLLRDVLGSLKVGKALLNSAFAVSHIFWEPWSFVA